MEPDLTNEFDATPKASGEDTSPQNREELARAENALSSCPTSGTIETEVERQLQESIERLQLRNKRLGGAGRKRLRWLLRQGLPIDQARIQAAQPLNPRSKGPKRTRSDGSTPEMAAKKPKVAGGGNAPKEATSSLERAPPAPSFRQALEGKRVGILHQGFPEVGLTTDQMRAIQEAILEKIAVEVDSEEGIVKPKFLGATFRAGWMVLTCADEATADWLKGHANSLTPWEGASLRAVDEGDLPKATIVNAYFPNSAEDNNDKILKLVRGQNEGLNTKDWRVLKRNQEGAATHLTMSIDGPSVEILKKSSYKVSYKFGQVVIRTKSAKPKPPPRPPTQRKKAASGGAKGAKSAPLPAAGSSRGGRSKPAKKKPAVTATTPVGTEPTTKDPKGKGLSSKSAETLTRAQ